MINYVNLKKVGFGSIKRRNKRLQLSRLCFLAYSVRSLEIHLHSADVVNL